MNTKAVQSVPGKLVGFDSIRGIAAFLVFIFHFWGLNLVGDVKIGGVDLTAFFDSGHVGLDVFFVLSGFLIFRSVYKNGVGLRYFLRRFLRIAPIYYFSILVVVIFLVPGLLMTRDGWWDILSHFFFFQSFSAETYYGINPVLWSLSVEMIFYLFLPLFFLFTGRKMHRLILGMVAMALVSYWFRDWVMQFYDGWDWQERVIYTENFVGRLDQFAFGMLSSYLVIKFAKNKSFLLKILSIVIGVAGVFGIYYGLNTFHTLSSGFRDVYFLQMFLHSIIALSAAAIMFALAVTFKYVKAVVAFKPLGWLGVISYSFYIWHFVVAEKVAPLEMGIYWKFLLTFVLITALSTATYFLIEKPFLRMKKY